METCMNDIDVRTAQLEVLNPQDAFDVQMPLPRPLDSDEAMDELLQRWWGMAHAPVERAGWQLC